MEANQPIEIAAELTPELSPEISGQNRIQKRTYHYTLKNGEVVNKEYKQVIPRSFGKAGRPNAKLQLSDADLINIRDSFDKRVVVNGVIRHKSKAAIAREYNISLYHVNKILNTNFP